MALLLQTGHDSVGFSSSPKPPAAWRAAAASAVKPAPAAGTSTKGVDCEASDGGTAAALEQTRRISGSSDGSASTATGHTRAGGAFGKTGSCHWLLATVAPSMLRATSTMTFE